MIWVSNLLRYLTVLLLLLLVGGCSSNKAVVKEPAPLVALTDQQFKITSVWDFNFAMAAKRPQQQKYQPAFSKGFVYSVDDKGVIRALTTDRANQVWLYASGLNLSSGLAYADGLVIAGSRDGDVLALAADSGERVWQVKVSSEVLTAPAIDEQNVFVRTVDGKITALNTVNGERRWTYQEAVPSLSLHGLSRPVIDEERVYVGFADGRIAALNKRNGQELWQIPVALPQGRSELERLIDIDANMVQYDNFIYASAYNGRVVAIDKRSGRVVWMRDLSSYRGLLVDEQALYLIDDDDAVWALARRNGATLWKQEGLLQRSLTSPIMNNGHIVIGDVEGYVHWLDVSDGSFVARTRLGIKAVNQLQQDQDKVMYAIGVDGHLYRLQLDRLQLGSAQRQLHKQKGGVL